MFLEIIPSKCEAAAKKQKEAEDKEVIAEFDGISLHRVNNAKAPQCRILKLNPTKAPI